MDDHAPDNRFLIECEFGPTPLEVSLLFLGVAIATALLLLAWWRYMAMSDAARRRRFRMPDDFVMPQ